MNFQLFNITQKLFLVILSVRIIVVLIMIYI